MFRSIPSDVELLAHVVQKFSDASRVAELQGELTRLASEVRLLEAADDGANLTNLAQRGHGLRNERAS